MKQDAHHHTALRLHLIRHTSPAIAPGICYGQSDIALANTFDEEYQRVVSKLLPHYDHVYSSPLQRCQQLAQRLNGQQLHIEPALMELNFGAWEQRAWDDIPRTESQAWMDDFIHIAPPDGETLLAMQIRVLDFIKALTPRSNDSTSDSINIASINKPANSMQNIAIVTHAGVIRLLVAYVKQLALADIFQTQVDYGAVIELNYAEQQFSESVYFL